MKISIHQPNFMPWPGFFSKIEKSDIFVILDDVKCSKNSFFNRSRFISGEDVFWLTIPLLKKSYSSSIFEAKASDNRWIDKHIKYFKNSYSSTSEISFYRDIIEKYEKFKKSQEITISNFNISLIRQILKFLEIEVEIVKSSDLAISKEFVKEERIIEIVKNLSGKTYISGPGAKSYQNEDSFKKSGINLMYDSFKPSPDFLFSGECLSTVDYILREGKWKTRNLLTSS